MNSAAIVTPAAHPEPATPDTSSMDEEAAFAQATQGLLGVGAVPVLQYLQEPALAPVVQSALTPAAQHTPPSAAPGPAPETIIARAVARLHQAYQQTFGNTDGLRFEYEEDAISQGKRCRLTITRPNGASRTYTSPLAYQRKYDAKTHASTVAIENGAIEFIMSGGGQEPSEEERTPPPPPPPQQADSAATLLEMDESVKTIEQTCSSWTIGRIKPHWLLINESKFGRTQGCALRIRLGPRNSKVWSVPTVYNTAAEAKKACAEAALADGVLEYIKTWSSHAAGMSVDEPGSEFPNSSITLQQFFDALPKPFPEQVPGQTAVDINGPAWLNTTIQSARGGKIVPNFVWTVDPKLGFHGCLLRLERPGEVKSYLVDARFSKRAEAKAAVCLLAMSEGVGDYIRGVAKAVEEKLPAATRKHVTEVLTPLLNAEYRKVHGPGIQPQIEYDMDVDACGATMVVELGPSPTPQQVRKYTVPAEYRNRNDAKLAVIAHAVEQGVIEFLRFKGRPPPPGYVPYYAQQHENQYMNRKRKHWEGGGGEWAGPGGGGGWQNKKQRTGWGAYGGIQGAPGGGSGPQMNQYQQPAWNGQKKFQNATWGRHNGPGPQYGNAAGPSHAAGHIPAGPGGFGAAPFAPPVAPTAPAPYPAVGGVAMQPQPAVPQFGYGTGAAQPYYGGTPQQVPYAGTQHGVPGAPGGTYSAYYPPQTQPPVGGVSMPTQPYPQQFPYGAAYASPPAQAQVSGYQAYPSAAVQYPPVPSQTAYYPPAPAAVPAPQANAYPQVPTPYVRVPGVSPASNPAVPTVGAAYTPYQSPYGPQAPVQPTQSPVAPVPPVVQPSQPASTPHQPSLPPPPPPPFPQPTPPSSIPPPTPPSVPPHNPTPTNGADKKPRASLHSTPTPPLTKQTSPAPLLSGERTAQNGKSKKAAKVVVESAPKTNVTALYDHCRTAGMPTPQFHHEILKGEHAGEPKHKVWVIIGKMKFELPIEFSSLSQGQEKVAKKVLDQLRQTQNAKAGKS
ncbi:hypothetical protein OH77DRAFT_1519559 [Trametes cingulata]|nr:hypothetical protein OH77DRAFT_1519559 [Trametes cingulata]